MSTIINIIIKFFETQLSKIILAICNTLNSFFKYKFRVMDQKKKEEEKKITKELYNDIDEVTKNGTLDDLLNLRKKK